MLYIHLSALFVSLGLIVVADTEGMSWIRGKKDTLSRKRMYSIHRLTWAALLIFIASGLWMFLPRATYLLAQPLFIIKLLFVATLVVNAILIGRLMEGALLKPFATLSWEERLPFFVSGAVSTFCWVSTILIAFYLF